MTQTAQRFGEVVEASVERLVGQCHRLYEAPPLGALVRAGDAEHAIYAVVTGVATASLDPTRRVIARGADLESDADVYREHPQLERLLRTDVSLAVVGHADAGALRQYLPPLPPRIHTSLHACAPGETREFTARFDFLGLLAGRVEPAADDVLAAALRQAAPAHERPGDFLHDAGRAVAAIMGADTARLTAVLRRLPLGGEGA